MHRHIKQRNANDYSDLLMVDFHHFLQMEKSATYLEIATELGISIQEVKQLKKRAGRS
ncbi:sigma factor-like helix-turn-helix DNA-binding protein [Oceanobacillus timonensis]|uniref:sigma factor-like helix-turn-helix DNA-binding protein n=1 Tax=Oceanobacillus timonensis TaxID=1926285 RepID=UPI0015C4D3ED|nr:sigma factor-like helix-turn-helix DNA-binding protein [Oceanobacillus timonensis]